MNPRGRGADDELVNLGLVLVAAIGVIAATLRLAGSAAAWLSGAGQPEHGWQAGLQVLGDPTHPAEALGSTGLVAWVYWVVLALIVAIVLASSLVLWRRMGMIRHRMSSDPRRLAGVATGRDVRAFASRKALLARGKALRPSLDRPEPSEVGYRLGRSRGHDVWASVEDSILILGPPRSGKGLHVVVNAILDAPGAVITTATRPDNVAATILERQRRGPVAVFDPQRLADGLPAGLRWSPVRGCSDPLTAMIRATGLASATGLSTGGVESGGFWEGKTRTALQALLHAAALDNRTPRELFGWTLAPSAAADAVAILSSDPEAAPGWADSLESMIHADPRTRDSIWMGVSLALSCLADPRVLDAVSPDPGEGFDPDDFLTNNGTLYLLATGAGAGASWSLVAAFIEDLVETARHLAASSPGARLDPPLLLALDEIGNLSPLPSLPMLMAEGGGTGITTMPVLQSLSQARDKWGDHAAGAIWDASIVKVILGGGSSARDLQDLSALIGERDERTDTISIGDYGSRSLQRSTRRVPVMPPETIRTLPFGNALVLLRSAPPLVTDLHAWTSREDAEELREGRALVEAALRRGSSRTPDW
ncbi:Type IV secretory pathway, VirD4 component, TraG/TraD family ATPase [Nocardioides alpinus]|uniref:Type IV secretory pathway, VirD4 component, TraG/TraD family ATPase n=1 Tax=Nocardioides alpinus TaxID=748909 RepID=A0A1I1AQZ7_9ACTN|nr:type VI secretion protein [Nocardioides alpinus]SFB38770.1 Type IV secretory pathway, VirD4 component, TraG/TraD family ATPase [Nocardioides alpinus]